MSFNQAKGVLVVDPIEVRGVRGKQLKSNIYILFQVGSIFLRSKQISTNGVSHGWREDSQCRFDVNPGIQPTMKVLLMEATTGLPIVLGKGEVDLVDIFYKKRTDEWIKLMPLGQVNIEFTLYELAPMVPLKIEKQEEPVEQEEQKVEKEEKKAPKVISSIDQVFVDDYEEEISRLRQLARLVKRRYKESMSHNYEGRPKSTRRTNSINADILVQEVKKSSPIEKPKEPRALPPLPPSSELKDDTENEKHDTLERQSSLFQRKSATLNPDELKTLNEVDINSLLNSLPYSATSIGGDGLTKIKEVKKQYEVERLNNLVYKPVSPEEYMLIDRLEKGAFRKGDLRIECGVSQYTGDAKWKLKGLRDSVRTNEPPKLPPKIPVGLRSDEYFVLFKKDCIDYIKKSNQVNVL